MNHYRISIPSMSFAFHPLPGSFCLRSETNRDTCQLTEPTGTVLALVGPNGGHVLSMADLKTLPVHRRTRRHQEQHRTNHHTRAIQRCVDSRIWLPPWAVPLIRPWA